MHASLARQIDGTLVYTDDLYFRAFQQLLAPFGHVVDEAFYRENILGRVDAEVFRAVMPAGTTEAELLALSEQKDALFCELYRHHAAEHGPPALPGLASALSTASALGIRCIAVTNAPRGAAEACIASLRDALPPDAVAALAADIVVGAECAQAKPHPEPYLEAMRRLGCRPERALAFEDSASGVRSAVAAGCGAVVGMRSSMSDADLLALGAHATLDDWHGLTREFLEDVAPVPRQASSLRLGAEMGGAAGRALLLLLGAVLSAAPGASAEATLRCRSADTRIPTAAARAVGSGLLPLVASSHMLAGREDLPLEARGALTAALLASLCAQAVALAQDGHVLQPWARRLLLAPIMLITASTIAGGSRAVAALA